MAHIIHSINITINGCCDHSQVIADDEQHAYAAQLLSSAEIVLLGRNTFNLFENSWPLAVYHLDLPSQARQFAELLEEKKKFVVSNGPFKSTWANCFPVSGDLSTEIAKLRAETAGNIVILGSPSLGRSLTELGEIDEYHFLLQPIAVDDEPRLFRSLRTPSKFKLKDVTPFNSGVLLMRYQHLA